MWWDDDSRTATCLSCAGAMGLLDTAGAPAAPAEPAPDPEPLPPLRTAQNVIDEAMAGERSPLLAEDLFDTVGTSGAVPDRRPDLDEAAALGALFEPEPGPTDRNLGAEDDRETEAELEAEPTSGPDPDEVRGEAVTELSAPRRFTVAPLSARRFTSHGAAAIDAVEDRDVDRPQHVQSAADLISRLRSASSMPTRRFGDDLLVERPDPSVNRGPVDDSPVTAALEAARIHGLEVIHRIDVGGGPIDHLVVAVNGVWAVTEERELTGLLAKRDLGDWFTADARLYVGEDDRTDLVASARDRAAAVRQLLSTTAYATVPVRPVVCFGDVAPGWVSDPFVVGAVSVTWRAHLVEPMLDPVLLDGDRRTDLVSLLAAAAA